MKRVGEAADFGFVSLRVRDGFRTDNAVKVQETAPLRIDHERNIRPGEHFENAAYTCLGTGIVQDNKMLRFDGINIALHLLSLKRNHVVEYREILDAVRIVMPFFEDFFPDVAESEQKGKVRLSWLQKGSDRPMQPYHFSDGSIRFLCLATALLQPNPLSTIIIDEPELGLHPTAIAVLAELMQNASKRTQLVVATQSPALIDHFDVEDVIVARRKDGASIFERLLKKDFHVWLETYSVGGKNLIFAIVSSNTLNPTCV